MKSIVQLFIFSLIVSFSFTLKAQDYEHILNYHSELYIQKDCRVLIKEKIRVLAKGQQIQRGIFREIPLSYQYRGGNYHVDLDLISVTKNGSKEPYHTENMSNGIRIYAGEEDVFLPNGIYEYEFVYMVDHVLGFFDDYDELYWNINGNGWQFVIDTISADVFLPDGGKYVQSMAYTGAFGEAGTDYKSWQGNAGIHFRGTRMFLPGENLTVSVAWEKNAVVYPTAWEQFLHWVETYILIILGSIGILITLLTNVFFWWKYGRDPKPGTIIPLFYPPAGFSPAECAYLKRAGRKTNEMFGSNLLSLAVKGYINIETEKSGTWGNKNSYIITREDGRTKKGLLEMEDRFLAQLLGSSSSIAITQGKYNPKVANANNDLIQSIDNKQKDIYFRRNRMLSLKTYLVPLVTLVAAIVAFFMFGGNPFFAFAPIGVQIVNNLVFLRLLEQPTKEGRRLMDEIAGFEMYMKYADRERIRLNNPPTMDFAHFEANLAYAIALGVAAEWAGQFDPKEIEQFTSGYMPYYHGMAIGSLASFSDNLNSTISSASVPPSSGSGSGGGGFSGGGGGGGGGGGW